MDSFRLRPVGVGRLRTSFEGRENPSCGNGRPQLCRRGGGGQEVSAKAVGTHLATRQGVEARERWQALQGHLSAARHALSEGNRGRALQEIDAALAIDPNFTAAVALRERISIGPDTPPLARTAPPLVPTATHVAAPAALAAAEMPLHRTIEFPQPVRAAAVRLLVSSEGYARCEERAWGRRTRRGA